MPHILQTAVIPVCDDGIADGLEFLQIIHDPAADDIGTYRFHQKTRRTEPASELPLGICSQLLPLQDGLNQHYEHRQYFTVRHSFSP